MGFESLTDDAIKALIEMEKIVSNPRAHLKKKGSHEEKGYNLTGPNGEEFHMYVRQNTIEGMEDDFSCGLRYTLNGEDITLVRYNGSSHNHPNHLEKTDTNYECHIHMATERYIQAGRKAEGFAIPTDKYKTLKGAVYAVIVDCNIKNLPLGPEKPDTPDLFSTSE